jgi:outer membrane biosynthesis protein TonB
MTLLAAMALLAAATAQSSGQAGGLQADFNAATVAAEAGDCAKAVPLFEALARNPEVKPGSVPAAAIQVRMGQCLVQLSRPEEGEAAILRGLPRLEAAGDQLANDVALAYESLGLLSQVRGDLAEARQRYERALRRESGEARLSVLFRLAKVSTFDPGPQPLAYADEALSMAAAQPKPSKDLLAKLHTLHARILLNRGQTQEAYTELKQALSLSGGLTMRTSMSEAALRGDLAIAALLLGKKDDARLYLAWTGAGRIAQSPFVYAAYMAPPDCGEETGLKPEDRAVVEFSIADDGSVAAAETVYSRGGPAVAAAFAKAVRDWYWDPADVAKIPPFYKLATRAELRCTTSGGAAPSILKPLGERFGHWAVPTLGLPTTDSPQSSEWIARLQAKRAEREAANDAPGQVAAAGLIALVDNRTNAGTVAMLDKALLLAGKPDVPVEGINTLRVLRYLSTAAMRRDHKPDAAAGQALLADRAMSADALAADTVRLTLAMPYRRPRQEEQATPLLGQVADDERLAPHHPLRQVAQLKLANLAAVAGDLAAAQAYFARTGLTEQQCALIGARPALRRTGADASDFPMEALRYGFEGWVKLEFDITAEGRVSGARPVIAYPPYVFVDAATGMANGIRYEPSYRPSGGVACNANSEMIRFVIPANH